MTDTLILAIEGELTIYTVADWQQRLLAALQTLEERAGLTLDLAQVGELDGAGLQLLIATHKAAQAQGKTLTLVAPSEAVLATFSFCGLDANLSGIDAAPSEPPAP